MSTAPEIDGLQALRSGILILIVYALLVGIGFISLIPAILAGLAGIAAAAIIILIGLILALIGLLRIRTGFNILKSIGRDVGVGGTGVTLYLVGAILGIIGAILTIVLIGIPILFLGLILLLIGQILIGVGIHNIGSTYKEGLVSVGGILVAIPIDIISFIGYILSYIGLGRVIDKVRSGFSPMGYGVAYQQAPVQQVGQGTIRSDGNAYITLSSQVQGTIVSAVLNNMPARSINPSMLNMGINNVVINFGSVVGLTPGYTYTITLTINTGANVITVYANVVYQP